MPIYFFQLHENGFVLDDEEGISLVDEASARVMAVRAARDVLAGAVQRGDLPLADVIVVTNDVGVTVFSLTLGAAVGQPAR